MNANLSLPERPKILVIALRRLGDVLLTTPLVRSLRRGYPQARIDVLVFAGTEGILHGNPDIDAVLTVQRRGALTESLSLVRAIGLKYDLAVSTQTGDRPTFLAMAAGRRRIGFVPSRGGGSWWKKRALSGGVTANPHNHRVTELLRLAVRLGLEPHGEIVCPAGVSSNTFAPRRAYAVLHANPMFRYRRWTDASWRTLARALTQRGMTVVTTGGPDAAECAYLDTLWGGTDVPVERLDGRLDWPRLATLLQGAAVYVGADTSMTHLAAGTGCPTIALFGPTDPRLWGPWPKGGLGEMWQATGSIQRRGNVWIVQHVLPCLPCQKEGCERHRDSRAACLDDLTPSEVLLAVDQALAAAPRTAVAQ